MKNRIDVQKIIDDSNKAMEKLDAELPNAKLSKEDAAELVNDIEGFLDEFQKIQPEKGLTKISS